MPRIPWIEDEDAEGTRLGEIYRRWKEANPGRDRMPGILKTFSRNPDLLEKIIELVYPLHFAEGHLTRRVKEMIATYVSGLNACPY